MTDYQARAAQLPDEIPVIDETQRAKAQRTLAQLAVRAFPKSDSDAKAAMEEVWQMLGLHPDQHHDDAALVEVHRDWNNGTPARRINLNPLSINGKGLGR